MAPPAPVSSPRRSSRRRNPADGRGLTRPRPGSVFRAENGIENAHFLSRNFRKFRAPPLSWSMRKTTGTRRWASPEFTPGSTVRPMAVGAAAPLPGPSRRHTRHARWRSGPAGAACRGVVPRTHGIDPDRPYTGSPPSPGPPRVRSLIAQIQAPPPYSCPLSAPGSASSSNAAIASA